MDTQLEYVTCNLCGEDRTKVFLRGHERVNIVKCCNDDLVYMNPRPRADALRAFHASFVREDNLALFTHHRRRVLRRIAQSIQARKAGGNLLDVGCATGTFFEVFTGGNWSLYGVDLSSLGVELTRRRFRAEVRCGSVQDARFPDRFFDVVTVLDTLFYTPDPRAELAEIRRILKHDGLLAVEIPGFTYRLLRERGPLCLLLDGAWTRGFTDSSHLYYFSPATLSALLKSTGFRLLEVIPQQASRARSGLWSVLNDLHFALARALFAVSAGRLSIAAKELYLSMKASDPALDRSAGRPA